MELYAGLDVHSKMSAFAVQDGEGRMKCQGEVPTTPEGLGLLGNRYGLPAGTRVALESGTVAFFAARQLARLGFEPVVVDAREVRLKAHRPRQKSDGRDARELCEGLRRGIYRALVHVPPEPIDRLRRTLSRRRHFVRLMTREVNAVKRLLRAEGLGALYKSLTTEAAWEKLLAALDGREELRAWAGMHRALWSRAREQAEELDGMLERERRLLAPEIGRLQTIPGVGPIVALTAVAFLWDAERFPSAKHAASYAGLVPATRQSGERTAGGNITRQGPAELRAMLCEAAHHARRPYHPLNPYFAKLCARRGYKMAVVAVAHRLCRIMYAMLRHRREFEAGRLAVEAGPFEKTTVRLYRLKPAPRAGR